MAHIMKIKKGGVGPLVNHYERRWDGNLGRENIDATRTPLNYNLRPSAHTVVQRIDQAVKRHEEASGKAIRSDANVLFDWVVTLPEDCPQASEREFFEAVVGFVEERYGAKNITGAYVHLDETTPHVHIPVMPIIGEKLLASKMVTRADLKTFHTALSKAVEAELGFKVSVELSEEKKAKKALSSVPHEQLDAARQALEEELNQATAVAQNKLAELQSELVQTSKAVEDKRAVLATLERQLEVLKADVQDFVRDYLQAPFARIKELIAEFGAAKAQDLIAEKEKSFMSRLKDIFGGAAKPESAPVGAATTGGLTDDVKPITTPQERVAVEQPKAVPARKPSFAAAKAAAVGARDAGAKEPSVGKKHEQER